LLSPPSTLARVPSGETEQSGRSSPQSSRAASIGQSVPGSQRQSPRKAKTQGQPDPDSDSDESVSVEKEPTPQRKSPVSRRRSTSARGSVFAKQQQNRKAPGSILQDLNLRHNCLGSYGAILFAKVLSTNINLVRVNLAWNGIGGTGAEALAKALKDSQIQDLDLRDNFLGGTPTFGSTLEAALSAHPNNHLRVLHLGGNGFTEATIGLFAKAIRGLVALQTLNLNNNPAICCNRHSEHSVTGVTHLAEALPAGSMMSLSLANCHLQDSGCEEVLDGLRRSEVRLTFLCLSDNRLTSAVPLRNLAEYLKGNHMIEHFDISFNCLGSHLVMQLIRIVAEFLPVAHLNCAANGLDPDGRSLVKQHVQREKGRSAASVRRMTVAAVDHVYAQSPLETSLAFVARFNLDGRLTL